MKVLLVNPPSINIIRESLPPVIEDDSGVFPPLGLLYIAAYVEEVEGCTVKVLDCQAENIDYEKLPAKIRELSPDIVGIQVMTFTLIDASMVAKAIRKESENAYIVFGGPHPTIFPKETVQIKEVDAVVAGEGEFAFSALVKAIVSKKVPENIPGVLTKKNPHSLIPWKHIEDLDTLKMPARHLIDSSKYNSPLAKKNPVTTMMSSRGCPAKCTFCDRPQMGKKFRMKSAENVVKEMRYCAEELNLGEILFYDDTFTINKTRVSDICDMIIDQGFKIAWDIRSRIDTITPELIKKLKKAGCYKIHYGVETGSPRIQKRLGKDLDMKRVKEIFSITKKEGFEVLGYFMFGCPGEEKEDIQKTMDLLLDLDMDYAHIAVFTPYPGTQVYKEALDSGFYKNDYWKEFAMNPKPDFAPQYWEENFSSDELQEFVKKAYVKFYARPGYILNRCLSVRSFDEFRRKATLGVKLIASSVNPSKFFKHDK